jgi:COP9 signalosome complex subunit 12
MVSVFSDFKAAHVTGSGPLLAAALTPANSPDDPNRLQSFYYAIKGVHPANELRHALLHDKFTGVKLPKPEGTAWVNIFTAFWSAVGDLLALDDLSYSSSWPKIFDSWKHVANELLKAYTGSHALPVWTIPCLYIVGTYLRAFAIKADADRSQDVYSSDFQDDVAATLEKNAKLEDAARTINRMFTICLNDRYAPAPHQCKSPCQLQQIPD